MSSIDCIEEGSICSRLYVCVSGVSCLSCKIRNCGLPYLFITLKASSCSTPGDLHALSKISHKCRAAQDAIDAAISVVGRDRAQRLWAPLLTEQAEQPVKLQWLPLLACWLTSLSPPSYSELESARSPGSHPPSSGKAQSSRAGSEAVSGRRDASPPPSPGKGSPQGVLAGLGPKSSPRSGASPRGNHENRQRPAQPAPEMSLDQHVEQAFQLQEAALRVGYAAAALPLWEHFLLRFFSHQVLTAFRNLSWHLCRLYEGGKQ